MDDQVTLAAGGHVDGILDHLDAAKMRAVIVAQKLVMIAGNVKQPDALARLPQQLLHDVIVKLRPIPRGLQLPAVDDIAHEIDGVGFVVAQEVEKLVRLAAARSEMDVRQKQRSNPAGLTRQPFRHPFSCARPRRAYR